MMEQTELKAVLDAHARWLESRTGERANLSGAELSYANLSRANLSGAELSYANLSRANLSGADLSGANLSRANLSCAQLSYANLRYANLSYADLRGADLSCAQLRGADLSCAQLRGANLSCAQLSGASLRGADLPAFWIIPESGSFIAWKKLSDRVVAQIEIPEKAKRTCSLTGRKCRAEYVKTLAMFKDGKRFKGTVKGIYDDTTYTVGKVTKSDKFNDDVRIECSNGIHFFVTRKEAEEYCG